MKITEIRKALKQINYILNFGKLTTEQTKDLFTKKDYLKKLLKSRLDLAKEIKLTQQYIIDTDKKLGRCK